ncbi:MAG: hypothetical protein QM679_07380 [Patulibacter sp.]
MSSGYRYAPLRERRLLVVLAGAACVGVRAATALERANVPHLAALAARGSCARLRAVAPHLPAQPSAAYAALLGVVPPQAPDQAAVVAAASGAALAAGERCMLVEVCDHAGRPAPALHVARAAEVLRARLSRQRVMMLPGGHQILLAGPHRPELPQVDGLELRGAPVGWLPASPPLDERTVVIAVVGSPLLGVAQLLGARCIAVDASISGAGAPAVVRLRSLATRELRAEPATVVVEAAGPLLARRSQRDEDAREAAVAAVLSGLDRGLLGPLYAVASWCGTAFAVTADLPRAGDGTPCQGEVPLIVAGWRGGAPARMPRRPVGVSVSLPPVYSERGLHDRTIVTTPFAVPPAQDPNAPQRFARDVQTGSIVGPLNNSRRGE